jgi:alpha-tubulin suppressor-like RCC1 family protein
MAFENNVQATLHANVVIGATTVDVVKAVAPNKDVPVIGRLTLSATDKTEIISYTGRTDNTTYWTLTGVTKNAESSFGDQAWSAGDACFQALTAADVANFTTVHSATAPTNPIVGTKWFNTTTGVLQEYLSDGTDSAWLDISSGTTVGTAATTTATVIAPIAQGYINSENSGTAAGCSYTYSAGTTTVTFNTAMADTNYSVITDKEGFDEHQVLTGSKTLTSFVMQSRDSAGTNVMSPASWPYSFVVYASDPVQSVVATSGGSFQSTNTLADGASVTHALGFAHNDKSIVQLRELIAGTTSVNSNWDFDTGDSALWSGNGTFSGGVLTLNEVTAGITVTQIATNGAYSLAVLSNGTVKGTGTNSNGQLGLGNNTNQTSWVLTGLSNITAVAMGDVHSLALNSSGSLFLTGSGGSGRTGFNSTSYNVWTNSGLSNVVSMDGGSEFSLAVLSDGTVKATGDNGRGQLGIGNNTRQWVWATSTITNVAKVFTGNQNSYALLNDGTVKVAGYNGYGSLGIGNNTHQSTWQSTSLTSVTKISPHDNGSLALISDGTVKASGDNAHSNLLFSGSTANTWTTSTITGVSDIAISAHHSIFIVGGVVKVVGRNNVGQLGLGDNTDRSVLTNTALTGASFISANGNNIASSCFVGFSNGTYKGTGTNGTGALGLGNTSAVNAWTTTSVGVPPVYATSTAVESLSALDTSGGNLSITNVDITNTAPTNTGILYALSFDNKTTWTSDMTETAIEAFDFSSVTLGTTAHVKITMTTTDTSVSPSVDQISLSLTTQGYLAHTTPSPTTYVVIDSGTQDVVITNNTGSTKTIRADISAAT